MENLKFSAVAFQCFSKEQVKKINKEIKKNLFHKEPQTEAAKNAFKIGDFFHIPCSPLMKLLHPEKSLYDIKLTCLLNLSEETYEGGEFYTISSNEEKKFTTGMGLIINSLIAHKVTPVTKGKRITLTYWAVGPSWR